MKSSEVVLYYSYVTITVNIYFSLKLKKDALEPLPQYDTRGGGTTVIQQHYKTKNKQNI